MHHRQNRGLARARSTGFRQVLESMQAGDVLVTMDADDTQLGSDPEHLRLEDFAINDPGKDRLTLADFRTKYAKAWDGYATIEHL